MLNTKKVKQWNKMRIGLVLSGGGAKGAYEVGAIRALYDLDLGDKLKYVSGTAAGALNAAVLTRSDPALLTQLWASIGFSDVLASSDKEDAPEKEGLLKRLSGVIETARDSIQKDVSKRNDNSILGAIFPDQGLFSQDGLEALLRDTVTADAIHSNPCRFYVCAYNTIQETPEYFCLNDMDYEHAVAYTLASAAIPYVFDPVVIDGVPYADGGINDPSYAEKNADVTPFLPLRDKPLDLIIVVHLRTDELPDYSAISHVPVIDIIPSKTLDPIKKGSGTMNFTKNHLQKIMDLGYRDALVTLTPKIMRLIR